MKQRNRLVYLFLFILLTLNCTSLYADTDYNSSKIRLIEDSYTEDLPSWLLLERGIEAMRLGEYGLASRVFREIIARDRINPDAEMYLGILFEQEGRISSC